jgi:hypothetical protein
MEQILSSFSESLRKDVEVVVRALPLDSGIRLSTGEVFNVDSFIHSDELPLFFKGERLKIPYRVYFNEPTEATETGLTSIQQTILNCIYLRHHNGYVRQRRMERLADKTEAFIVPFSLQLLGEYVMEILEVLDKHINGQTIDQYIAFIKENPKYWQQTQSRMVSYWNEYYRRKYPNLNDYIGKKIADRLKKRTHNI